MARRSPRAGASRAVAALLVAAGMMVPAEMASTATAGPVAASAPFYVPPAQLPPGEPGDLIRSAPAHLTLSLPSPNGELPAQATRIMYRSTDATGQPTPVTGTMLEPTVPWNGPGPRPLVSVAYGTIGQGDHCAPSHLLLDELVQFRPPADVIAGYDNLFVYSLLSRGFAVVISDYEGLGTPGTHTYLNPRSGGHAVIDAARAAQRLEGTSVPADGPVGFWGYSQGGGAAGGAAEMVGAYAPRMDVAGSFVGAPPTDLTALLHTLDGDTLSGVQGYFLNGLKEAYPDTRPVIDGFLNPAGHQMLERTAAQCAGGTAIEFGFTPTGQFTTSGATIADELSASPVTRDVVDGLRLGTRAPSHPVMLSVASDDDVVPAAPVSDLADTWRAQGTDVTLTSDPAPLGVPGTGLAHATYSPFAIFTHGLQWFEQQFVRAASATG